MNAVPPAAKRGAPDRSTHEQIRASSLRQCHTPFLQTMFAETALGPPGDEAWNGVVLRHGADQILVTPVPEEAVAPQRRELARKDGSVRARASKYSLCSRTDDDVLSPS